MKIRPVFFAVGDDKKKINGREEKGRYIKSQVSYISATSGEDPLDRFPISTKIGMVVGGRSAYRVNN